MKLDSMADLTRPAFLAIGGFVVLSCLMLWFGRWMERKNRLAASTGDDGKVVGIVGLPGDGKTSFAVSNYVIPALKAGETAVTNFDVYPDPAWPGQWRKFRASTFGEDLLGIGSTLNVDPETGVPMSGWFVDTKCTCGKDHDGDCERPYGEIPWGTSCCRGFRMRRLCGCNRVLLVVDEIQSFIPANQSKPLPIDVLTWLTMIRKNHVLLVWLTQYWKWVHSGVRRLTPQGIVCSRDVLASDRIARMYDVDPDKAEMRDDVLAKFKYKPAMSAGPWYDSGEVIVPSQTAYELLGQMSKRSVLPNKGGGGDEARGAPPLVQYVTD